MEKEEIRRQRVFAVVRAGSIPCFLIQAKQVPATQKEEEKIIEWEGR
jgi:hypothetical protein